MSCEFIPTRFSSQLNPTHCQLLSTFRNFRVKCTDDLVVDCHAYQLLRLKTVSASSTPSPKLLTYGSREDKTLGLFSWVRYVIEETLGNS